MKITSRSKIIVDEVTFEYCHEYIKENISHFKLLTPEISNGLVNWLESHKHTPSISKTAFGYAMLRLYTVGKRLNPISVEFWTRRGWDEQAAKEKVSKMQRTRSVVCIDYYLARGYAEDEAQKIMLEIRRTSREKNLQRLTRELGSEEKAKAYMLARDRAASFRTVDFYLARGATPEEAKTSVKVAQGKEMTDEIKEKIKRSSKRSTIYWENQGYSKSEAIKMVGDQQRTFSLNTCIEKYGEVEGRARFKNRQEKWQNTLKSKSPEEIERINRLKIKNSGCISKVSQQLFSEISIEGDFWGIKSNGVLGEMYIRTPSRHCKVDFVRNNKIIEFNGDFWHANPKYYHEDDLMFWSEGKQRTAKEIWERDAKREKELIELGYSVLVIWESDFVNNPKETIQKCKDYLEN